jgi:hypothetical protein
LSSYWDSRPWIHFQLFSKVQLKSYEHEISFNIAIGQSSMHLA